MPSTLTKYLPAAIGIMVAAILYTTLHWWGFLVIFPWIGLSISIGVYLRQTLTGKKKLIGRKVAILMILPCLLLFVPIVNNENFQLEGIVIILMVGFFSKGFIHYCVAKLFGPLIWSRGFCGYACWTAAVLDWLPIRKPNNTIPRSYRKLRYIALALSVLLPVMIVFGFSYDPWNDYINIHEMKWMFISNGIYYLIAIPLAFILSDKRAFCKYVCPVSLVMTPTTRLGLIKILPDTANTCTGCRTCNNHCPMGVDVMSYMLADKPVTDTECILCNDCSIVCPTKKIK